MSTDVLLGKLDASVDSLWEANFEGDPSLEMKRLKEIKAIIDLLEKEILAKVSRDKGD